MLGRLLSFGDGKIVGAMLNFRGVEVTKKDSAINTSNIYKIDSYKTILDSTLDSATKLVVRSFRVKHIAWFTIHHSDHWSWIFKHANKPGNYSNRVNSQLCRSIDVHSWNLPLTYLTSLLSRFLVFPPSANLCSNTKISAFRMPWIFHQSMKIVQWLPLFL